MTMSHRPALGQFAELGALYDARSDSFTGLSLLSSSPPATALTLRDNHTTEVQFSFSDNYEEKLSKMNVNAELSASFLAGMITVGGSGSYLNDKRESNRIAQASLHYSFTTAQESLNLSDTQLKQCLAFNVLQTGSVATHVVVGIGWGARIVLTIKSRLSSEDQRQEIEGQFKAEFAKLKSVIKISGSADLGMETAETSKGTCFEVAIYGDVLTDDGLMPSDFESACQFVSNVPKYVAAANKGKGKPLTYTLLPLSVLSILFQVEIMADITVQQLSVECLRRFVIFFDEMRDAQQRLNDCYEEITQHRFCVPEDHVNDVARRITDARAAEADLKSKYARVLIDVRSGVSGAAELSGVLEEALHKETTPRSIVELTNKYKEKMYFADMFIAKGVKYLGFEGRGLSTELFNNKHDDAYVFYFSEEARRESSSSEGNQHLLHELLDDVGSNSLILMVDCDARNQKLEKACIKQYRNSKVLVPDLFALRHLTAGWCLARSDTFDRSGVQPSPQRRAVTIACPGQYCSPRDRHEWICFHCHSTVEYGYTDDYLYCDCGRSLYYNYDFKCKEARHGAAFAPYEKRALLQLLKGLKPFKELNILILGETGVGKSTFINAFINYLSFDTLDDAMNDKELRWVIPCSFATQKIGPDGRFVQKDVQIGQSKYENDGSTGQSATQKTVPYAVRLPDNTMVRLIDTPGIGDTRGVQQDQANMADLLSMLRFFDNLHGILILLKSNNSRLNVMFRFCIKELLTHLHKDAAQNMVFGFTNTRISNYTPGDTLKPLEALLKEHSDIGIELTYHTAYCFDSESFRFLAAHKAEVEMENIEDFRRSWQSSKKEAQRLLQHFRELSPHLVNSTLSVNKARELIIKLTKPMAEISRLIEHTIENNQKKVDELNTEELKGRQLQDKLHFQKLFLRPHQLEKPRTVCTDVSCVEFRDGEDGNKQTVYKTHCHHECYLKSISLEVAGAPGLQGCFAFQSGDYCYNCGHHWMQHQHVQYELHQESEFVKDNGVVELLKVHANDITLKKTAIASIEKQIQESRNEYDQIQNAAVQFGLFLKQKSMTPYNDAMISYLDHLINQEQDKVGIVDGSPMRVKALKRHKAQYQERIDVISKAIANPLQKKKPLDERGVDGLIQRLYSLKHWGGNLKAILTVAEAAQSASYRETQFRVPTRILSIVSSLQNQVTWLE